MKTLSIEEQLALIYPREISLTKDELDILDFEIKFHRFDDDEEQFIVYSHPLTTADADLLDKAKSFADMIGHDNNDDNLLVWFYDLYQAQQAQKQ